MTSLASSITLKIQIDNWFDDKWSLFHHETFIEIPKETISNEFGPKQTHLMNQDIIEVDDLSTMSNLRIIHSSSRTQQYIPAVITLNRAYGRIPHKRNPILLYRAIPDDSRLSPFLVPYKEKVSFSKFKKPIYVIIRYKEWKDTNEFPYGEITQTIGDVDHLPNFYEYQLFCRSLHASIKTFTSAARERMRSRGEDEIVNHLVEQYSKKYSSPLVNRFDREIISIDSNTTKDIDDAFGVYKSPVDSTLVLSIYISNVAIWMDELDLWSSFSRRVATIYLPDRKRPMIPTLLSEGLCSLLEGRRRIAFTIDIHFDLDTNDNKYYITHYDFKNTLIKVTKNWDYMDTLLEQNATYKMAMNICRNVKNVPFSNTVKTIDNTHDLVAYQMVMMNYFAAKLLQENRTGIYRSLVIPEEEIANIPKHLPANTLRFLEGWNSNGSKYVTFKEHAGHDLLKLDSYIHITSPIRRLVDLLNILEVERCLQLRTKDELSHTFYNEWTTDERMDYINVTMKSIRKVQQECELLHRCTMDEGMLERHYSGIVFDRVVRSDGLNQYMVYLPEIRMLAKYVTMDRVANYDTETFQLYIFKNESKFKKKVMLTRVR